MHRLAFFILIISILIGGNYYWNTFRFTKNISTDVLKQDKILEPIKVSGPIQEFPPVSTRTMTTNALTMIEIAAKKPAQVQLVDVTGKKLGVNEMDPDGKVNWTILLDAKTGGYTVDIITEKGQPYSVAVYGTNIEGTVETKLIEGIAGSAPNKHLFYFDASASADIINVKN